jgi:hypothetical protein
MHRRASIALLVTGSALNDVGICALLLLLLIGSIVGGEGRKRLLRGSWGVESELLAKS